MKNKPPSLAGDLAFAARGMLMGGADVIPGVSGGTVALIVGIYERLVTAISHFDLHLIGLLRGGRWGEAARHVDLRFLAALFFGIVTGIVSLGGLMNRLLTTAGSREQTLAAFFGMILASSVLVARMISIRRVTDVLLSVALGCAGAAFAFWLTGLSGVEADITTTYVFLCGMVAICAMILPGISGAYVLLIMGAYLPLTEILKGLPHGRFNAGDLLTVLVFITGCAIGLVSFSKVLRWLLARHQSQTMAVLCGFMVGALRKIWPFQQDLTPHIEKLKHKQFRNVLPDALDGHVLTCLAIAVVALVAVFVIDWCTAGHEHSTLEEPGTEERSDQAVVS